ncbi:unnamed protein product [Prunus armeniaca]
MARSGSVCRPRFGAGSASKRPRFGGGALNRHTSASRRTGRCRSGLHRASVELKTTVGEGLVFGVDSSRGRWYRFQLPAFLFLPLEAKHKAPRRLRDAYTLEDLPNGTMAYLLFGRWWECGNGRDVPMAIPNHRTKAPTVSSTSSRRLA